jgi:hypothetical protein
MTHCIARNLEEDRGIFSHGSMLALVRVGSCVTSNAGPHGGA